MDILLIGGPKFVGRGLIDAALAAGHTLTMFNRGQTNPDLYPQVEKLRGDRDGQLDALRGRTWDAVVDTSGYLPRVVRQSADLLADAVGRYVFISSISVYEDPAGAAEDAPLIALEDETTEDIASAYGGLKVLCERAVQEVFGERATIIRPGIIVGPHDPTDRFTYWPVRVEQGGDVLAPASPDYPVQVIDVRDLAAWTVKLIEGDTGGVFNATGPEQPVSFGTLLETCRTITGSDARFVWADADFLREQAVSPWSDLPLWLPDTLWGTADVSRAQAAGLRYRPLEQIIRDTLNWVHHERGPEPLKAGLKPQREADLLAAWQADA